MSAQEITATYDCKTPNCDREARSRVGRYSYCDVCRESRARIAQQVDTIRPGENTLRLAAAPAGSYEQRAKDASKKLIAAGKAVDKSKATATTAARAYKDAQAAWDAALRELGGQS